MDKSGKKRLYNLICFSFFHVSTYPMSTLSGMIHMTCKMMHDVFSNIFKEVTGVMQTVVFLLPTAV